MLVTPTRIQNGWGGRPSSAGESWRCLVTRGKCNCRAGNEANKQIQHATLPQYHILPLPPGDQQQRKEVARRFVTRALWPPGATLEPTPRTPPSPSPPPGVVVALLVAPPVVVFVAVAVAAVPRVGERCRRRLLF